MTIKKEEKQIREKLGGRMVPASQTPSGEDSQKRSKRLQEIVSSKSAGIEEVKKSAASSASNNQRESRDSGGARETHPRKSSDSPRGALGRPDFKPSAHLTGRPFNVEKEEPDGSDRLKPSRLRALFNDDELIGTTG